MRAFSNVPVFHAITAVLLCASACATAAPPRVSDLRSERVNSTNEPPRIGARSEVLSRDELRNGSASSFAATLRQLRPEYFRTTMVPQVNGGSAASGPAVYLNGVYAGGTAALETIPLDAVDEVRYIRPAQAREWWGAHCPCEGGVIYVRATPGHSNRPAND